MKYQKEVLIKNVDSSHSIFKSNNTEKYIGLINIINNNNIGQIFDMQNLIKRHLILEYDESENGLWKLINIKIAISKTEPYFYYFRNNKTKEIIECTNTILLNNGILFLNYNLILLQSYKSFQWKPYNIDDIIPINFQKIKLVNTFKNGYFGKKEDDKLINILPTEKISAYYIGKDILIEMLPKYLSYNILYENIDKVSLKKYYDDITIDKNIHISNIISNTPNKHISSRFYNTSYNSTIAVMANDFITDENIGKQITYNLNKLYITRKAIPNENSNYTLRSILNFIEIQIYCFSDSYGYLYFYLIENNPNLSSSLGKKFELDNRKLYLGSDIMHNKEGLWEFLSVIDEIYNFKNIETNKITSLLINNQSTPVISNIGKTFNMDIYDIYWGEF